MSPQFLLLLPIPIFLPVFSASATLTNIKIYEFRHLKKNTINKKSMLKKINDKNICFNICSWPFAANINEFKCSWDTVFLKQEINLWILKSNQMSQVNFCAKAVNVSSRHLRNVVRCINICTNVPKNRKLPATAFASWNCNWLYIKDGCTHCEISDRFVDSH